MQDILYALSAFSLVVVSITMLARANDLRWRKGLVWNVRLLGFIATGVSCWGIALYEWALTSGPTLYDVIFRVGVMLVFMTSPYLPPWWKWIGFGEKKDEST